MTLNKYSRASKQMGDFGEGLVTYALIKKKFEVAIVDHVGADLIAVKDGIRYAISVKTRNFKTGSKETRGYNIEYTHIEKLKHFAAQFALEPVIAYVVNVDDEKTIELYIVKINDLEESDILKKVQHGYYLNLGKKYKESLMNNPLVDYSFWQNETIGKMF